MANAPDSDERLDDALHELADAAEVFVQELTSLRDTLHELHDHIGPDALEAQMRAAGIDRATLNDFLSFGGDLASVTDRMMAAFVRVVSALN
jgi:hypothetical protein